ncbi:MAG TPA: hypothetical protein VKT70_05260 [Stellaceae bacterium]|nr:hypothetical protein [Stellaceae bacterium]
MKRHALSAVVALSLLLPAVPVRADFQDYSLDEALTATRNQEIRIAERKAAKRRVNNLLPAGISLENVKNSDLYQFGPPGVRQAIDDGLKNGTIKDVKDLKNIISGVLVTAATTSFAPPKPCSTPGSGAEPNPGE